MLDKAQGLPADQVFLDLEDAVAPLAKPAARKNIVAALNDGDWGGKTRVGAGQRPDHAVDVPGRDRGRRGRRRQPRLRHAAEGAGRGPGAVARPDRSPRSRRRSGSGRPASASRRRSRTRAAWSTWTRSRPRRRGSRRSSSGRPTSWPRSTCDRCVVGALIPDYPGRPVPLHPDADPDGRPHARPAGDRRAVPADPRRRRVPRGGQAVSARSASTASGCCTRARSTRPTRSTRPAQDDYDHAELILDAYEYSTSEAGGTLGAVMLGDEMIDEASRKMALVIAAKGRAAGMKRTSTQPPIG